MAGSVGPGLRHHTEQRGTAVRAELRRRHREHVLGALHQGGDLRDGRRGGLLVVPGDHHREAAGEARPEALADQVVGDPRRRPDRFRPGVRHRQPHVGRGQGEHAEPDQADQDDGQPEPDHQARPAEAERRAGRGRGPAIRCGRALPAGGPLLAGKHAPAGEAEQGRLKGDRDQDGDGDRAGGGQTHDGQERDAHHRQAGQCDDHRHAGEEHGRAGGTHRPADRLVRRQARRAGSAGSGR